MSERYSLKQSINKLNTKKNKEEEGKKERSTKPTEVREIKVINKRS